jgi:hypothetical protein
MRLQIHRLKRHDNAPKARIKGWIWPDHSNQLPPMAINSVNECFMFSRDLNELNRPNIATEGELRKDQTKCLPDSTRRWAEEVTVYRKPSARHPVQALIALNIGVPPLQFSRRSFVIVI